MDQQHGAGAEVMTRDSASDTPGAFAQEKVYDDCGQVTE